MLQFLAPCGLPHYAFYADIIDFQPYPGIQRHIAGTSSVFHKAFERFPEAYHSLTTANRVEIWIIYAVR